MADQFDPYHKWLGIPPEQRPPNHYQLLGVPDFEDDLSVIESLADQRMGYVRSMQTSRHAGLSQTILNELAAARVCLLNDAKRAAYNAELRKQLDGAITDVLSDLQPYAFDAGPVPSTRLAARRRSWLLPAASLGVVAAVTLIVIAFAFSGSGDRNDVTKTGARAGRAALPVSAARRTMVEREPVRDQGPVVAPAPEAAPDAWGDLLPLVDLKKHVVLGDWQRRGAEIFVQRAPLEKHWRFMVPVVVRGSYRLHVEFTRTGGNNVHVQLPVAGHGCTLILGGWSNTFSGLHLIDGERARDNASARSPAGILNGHRYALDVDVDVVGDQATIAVRLDGEPYLQWQGAATSLTVHELLALPVPDALGFGVANHTTLLLHAARVRATSGEVRVLTD